LITCGPAHTLQRPSPTTHKGPFVRLTLPSSHLLNEAKKIYIATPEAGAVDFQSFFTFGVSLFTIVDAIGNVPFFVAATEHFAGSARRWIIERASFIAAVVLIFFLLVGKFILDMLKVTVSSFQIAAGIVLFIISWDLLLARTSGTKTTEDERNEALSKDDIAVFPLAIPLLSGPGAITWCMYNGSQTTDIASKAIMLAVVVAVMMASLLILEAGAAITAAIGLTGMKVIRRIMGLLLSAVAVNYVVEGIKRTMPYMVS